MVRTSFFISFVYLLSTSSPFCRCINRKKGGTIHPPLQYCHLGNQYTACNKIICLMLKISYTGCLGLSVVISAQFTFKMCTTAKNFFKKRSKTNYFRGSRSLKITDVDTTEKLKMSACYDKQHVCAYLKPFYGTRSKVVKQRVFSGYPFFTPSFKANTRTKRHDILLR